MSRSRWEPNVVGMFLVLLLGLTIGVLILREGQPSTASMRD